MTRLDFAVRAVPGTAPGTRGKGHRSSASVSRALAVSLAVALTVLASQPSKATQPGPVKIAVFDFELIDKSAGDGIVEPDATDRENLRMSAEEARRMLSASGRYSLVDASSAADDVSSAGGVQHCKGCEGPLANELGADQSMIGIITRITRTEYTIQILVRDTQTGEALSKAFTGLRMGANYSWPRGVKSLMKSSILPAQDAE